MASPSLSPSKIIRLLLPLYLAISHSKFNNGFIHNPFPFLKPVSHTIDLKSGMRFRTRDVDSSSLRMSWSINRPLKSLWTLSRPIGQHISRVIKHLTFSTHARSKGYKSVALYCHSMPIVSDDTYEEWLDDIIYSGDIEGYLRRKSADLVNEDFLGFLQEREEVCIDNDEKSVLQEIILAIEAIMKQTDGIDGSGLAFEKRLDRLLFAPPQRRRDTIVESKEEMTPAFIAFIQSEIKKSEDKDAKVVLASLLQMIGQVKNEDYLSTGDEDYQTSLKYLSGVEQSAESSLDLSTNINDAVASSQGKTPLNTEDALYDQILAGLVFSKNDILEDVLNNLHYIDDKFVHFIEKKIATTTDIEERVALTSLLDTVNSVLNRVKEVQGDNAVDVSEELSLDQVKQRMKDVQMGNQDVKASKKEYAKLWDYELKNNKRDTFLGILKRFQNLPESVSLESVVEANYDLCDYQFMESLKEEIASCYAEGADLEGQQYEQLMLTVNKEMVKRISSAQDKLAIILSKPSQKAMETEIVAMVRKGEADEALMLLIEGNIQQAEQAGAKDAVRLLSALKKRIADEKERKLPDEQRLLRALLRESDVEKRKNLLYEAFRPSKSMNEDGEVVEGSPLISPPSFINVIKRVIQESGNVEGFQIMNRMQTIIDEAQVVATELYGKGMSTREQQQYMFQKNSVSVWDLAKMEEEAMMSGDVVPWANNAYDDKMPEDVLQERRVKQIGGLESYS